MLFDGSAKQYPNLVAYMNIATRQRFSPIRQMPAKVALAMMGSIGVAVVLGSEFPLYRVPILFSCFLAAIVYGRRSMAVGNQITPEQIRANDARDTLHVMRECLDKRRLHRDLDSGSLQLIEECARSWGRVHSVLSTGFWNRDDLGGHYQSVKDQTLAACDAGMQDLVLLYKPYLPSTVSSRHPLDYVEEALEPFAKNGKAPQNFLLPVFEKARGVAEKMRLLAEEVERIERESAHLEGVIPQSVGTALDLSLLELRAIRQAEDELQQETRG